MTHIQTPADRIAELEAENQHLKAALLFALPLLEEECRPGSPLLRQVYNALKMNEAAKPKPTGVWPDWGDSPNGFDGPGGAE